MQTALPWSVICHSTVIALHGVMLQHIWWQGVKMHLRYRHTLQMLWVAMGPYCPAMGLMDHALPWLQLVTWGLLHAL